MQPTNKQTEAMKRFQEQRAENYARLEPLIAGTPKAAVSNDREGVMNKEEVRAAVDAAVNEALVKAMVVCERATDPVEVWREAVNPDGTPYYDPEWLDLLESIGATCARMIGAMIATSRPQNIEIVRAYEDAARYRQLRDHMQPGHVATIFETEHPAEIDRLIDHDIRMTQGNW